MLQFLRKVNLFFVIYSYEWLELELKNLDKVYSKNLQNFNMDDFSWYVSIKFCILFLLNWVTSFIFSTSYDLNTYSKRWQCPFPLLYGCQTKRKQKQQLW